MLGHPIVGNSEYEHTHARSGNRVEAIHRGPGHRDEPDWLYLLRYNDVFASTTPGAAEAPLLTQRLNSASEISGVKLRQYGDYLDPHAAAVDECAG